MHLFHISDDINQREKTFIPRVPDKIYNGENNTIKRILKKCKDKIIKSNDLVYKYSTQELDLNNSKLIEMEIKNVWKQN